ncbi:MAG: DUF4190 domain-containing protein [Cyclobacteriaceae bacterium]
MKSNSLLISLLCLLIFSCSTSKIAKCPTGDYKKEEFKKMALTLKQKKMLNTYVPSNKIVFEALDGESDVKNEPIQYASLKEAPADSKTATLKNYKPFEASNTPQNSIISSNETKTSNKLGFVKKRLLNKVKSKKSNEKKDAAVKSSKAKKQATASLVLGLISLFIAGIPLGILAVIFGGISMNKLEKGEGRGMAVAGLVLGIVGIVGGLIFIALTA